MGLRRRVKIGPCDYTTPERPACLKMADVSSRSSFSSPSSQFPSRPPAAPQRDRARHRRQVHGVKHLRRSTHSSRRSCRRRARRRRARRGNARSSRDAAPAWTPTAPASDPLGKPALSCAGSRRRFFFSKSRILSQVSVLRYTILATTREREEGREMAEWLLSADLFRRFLDGRAKRDESKQIVRHLVRGCDECQALTSRLVAESGYWFPKRTSAAAEETYEQAFEAAFCFATEEERRIAVERLRGWGQWAAIESLLPEERSAAVFRDRDYHQWGFYRALLDACHWYSRNDPREAVNIVELALSFSDLLPVRMVGGPEAATDMRAKGYAILGNARRLASDLPGARAAINEAWRLNEEGTGDPLERARLISFDASYIRMMGEFETAEAALEEALHIYAAAGDGHMQGRTLIQMGGVLGYV